MRAPGVEVPEWLVALIGRLLEKSPDKRPATMDDVLRALADGAARSDLEPSRRTSSSALTPSPSSLSQPSLAPRSRRGPPFVLAGVLASATALALFLTVWYRFIWHQFCSNIPCLSIPAKLRQPLVPWLTPISNMDRLYHTMTNDSGSAYLRRNGQWTHHLPIVQRRPSRSTVAYSQRGRHIPRPPSHECYPLLLTTNLIGKKVVGKIHKRTPTIKHTNLQAYLQSLPTWEAQLFSKITITDEFIQLVSTTSSSRLFLVSDGSVKNGQGTYGWCIASSNENLADGSGFAYGDHQWMASSRAEAFGKLTASRLLQHDFHYFNTPIPALQFTIVSLCDNKSCNKRLMSLRDKPTQHDLADWLLRLRLLRQLKMTSFEMEHHFCDDSASASLAVTSQPNSFKIKL